MRKLWSAGAALSVALFMALALLNTGGYAQSAQVSQIGNSVVAHRTVTMRQFTALHVRLLGRPLAALHGRGIRILRVRPFAMLSGRVLRTLHVRQSATSRLLATRTLLRSQFAASRGVAGINPLLPFGASSEASPLPLSGTAGINPLLPFGASGINPLGSFGSMGASSLRSFGAVRARPFRDTRIHRHHRVHLRHAHVDQHEYQHFEIKVYNFDGCLASYCDYGFFGWW